ncbi:MAG: anthranilate synthase component I [Thiotrichales bacterium]|nr:anthranilate synthase component I [Thiotrichales bacterium]
MSDDQSITYVSDGGIAITRTARREPRADAVESLAAALDERLGVLLTSSFEYPGRYTRWDIGFCDPALSFTGRQRRFEVRACNERGAVLIPAVASVLRGYDAIEAIESDAHAVTGTVRVSDAWFPEELRSKQPTLFSVVRALIDLFRSPEDAHLGLYGAFGYELAFQFDPIRLAMPRDATERNVVLFLPDDILIVDHRRETATRYRYEFEAGGKRTHGLARTGGRTPYIAAGDAGSADRAGQSAGRAGQSAGRAGLVEHACDHAPGEYAATVRDAIEAFRRGDLFEVVPGQVFFEPCATPPSELYRRLKARNPAPYGALMNLGEQEYLVAASPEMYVRVEGRRIETCPISGTIARGTSAIGDARQIRTLLNSEKEESELTMCTDVDRNDKSRVCEAESVRVIGRRQIEMYSRLIHTVDHVEGRLREGYDALDGFLAHTWAVTVTGAPKQHAIQFIEDHERSPRRWYGGAIGFLGFDGNMNTGLTLRTVRVKSGVAEVRAGATLLFGSDPDAEEAETRLKASALLDAIRRGDDTPGPRIEAGAERPGDGRRMLMVDHEDSFVHTLAGYFRRTGAEVITYRSGFPRRRIAEERPDLVLLSPGPGRPADFGLGETIGATLATGIPLFGVCLGLQGIVEYYGGRLSVLPSPMHGKPSMVNVRGGRLFEGLPSRFEGGRYHSLHADRDTFPGALTITAESDEGIVMAVEHPDLPVAAVQFHPESILTLDEEAGLAVVMNVMRGLGGSGRDVA